MVNDRGSVLFLVIIFVIMLSLVGMTVISMNSMEEITARQEIDRVRALYLAEAGLERAFSWFNSSGQFPEGVLVSGSPNGVKPFNPFGGAVVLEPQPLSSPGSYTVTIDPYDTNTGNADKKYRITSTGSTRLFRKTIVVDIELHNGLEYAYFSEYEYEDSSSNPSTARPYDWTYFVACDTVAGKVFSNSTIAICGKPNFSKSGSQYQVSTHSNSFYYFSTPGTAPNSLDLKLSGTSAARVGMFDDVDLNQLALAAQKSSFYFSTDRTITLAGSGLRIGTDTSDTLYAIPGSQAVVYVKGDVTLKSNGTAFTKRLTIVSSGDIRIESRDIPVSAKGGGMLGLIANKNIIISKALPTTPADVTINATLMALNSFEVEDWQTRFKNYVDPFNPTPRRGALRVIGGVIQKYRGHTGKSYPSASADEPLTGYIKDYIYDPRVIDNPPPYFPGISPWKKVLRSEKPADRLM